MATTLGDNLSFDFLFQPQHESSLKIIFIDIKNIQETTGHIVIQKHANFSKKIFSKLRVWSTAQTL